MNLTGITRALRAWVRSPAARAHKRRAATARRMLKVGPRPPRPVPDPPRDVPTAARVVRAARSQVGYHEGRRGGHWNNVEKFAALVPGLAWANGQPWCDVFACWALMVGGLKPGVDFPVSASVATSAAWYRSHHRWSEYPAIGAQVIYGNGEHTGIVVAYDADTITTVEGNTNDNGSAEGDGVYVKHRQRRDPYVTGYGYPRYPEGIKSADPKR